MFRIDHIDAFALAIPMTTPIKMAGVSVHACDNLVVRIADGSGRVGWGEAPSAPTINGETSAGMVAAARFMATRLVGREIGDPADIPGLIGPLMYANDGAKSALDIALMDLAGQHRGTALCDLLGGRARDRAAMIWLVSGEADEQQIAGRRRDEGYVAFKVKVGLNDPEIDLARARATRAVVGPDARISADANQGFSPADALVFARGAGDAGLDFFEQPVMGHDIEAMQACARAATIPLGADEGFHSIADIELHHEKGAAAGGSLKLIKLGGTAHVLRAGQLMQRLGMHVNLAGKAADTSIGAAAIAHLALALPQLDWDATVTNQYLADDVAVNPVAITDGHITAPDGPGLGIAVDEDRIARYRVN